MRGLLRHSLIWMLAIALMVAGLPVAHAQNCDHQQAGSAQHSHHAMHMDAADEAVMDHASPSQRDDHSAATPCKCLNCSSVCAAFVAPMPQANALHRRSVAIVYGLGETSRNEATVFIDPGIPIAV